MNSNPVLLRGVDVLAVSAMLALLAATLAGVAGIGGSPVLASSAPGLGAMLAISGVLPAAYLVYFEVLQKSTLQEKLFGLLAWPAMIVLFVLLVVLILPLLKISAALAGGYAAVGTAGILATQLLCLLLILKGQDQFMGKPVRNHPGTRDHDPDDPWADELPDELRRWNIGAMLTAPLWAFAHRSRKGLVLLMVPVLALIAPFIIGWQANRWAWQNGMVDDVDTYIARQAYWQRAGWVVLGAMVLTSVL